VKLDIPDDYIPLILGALETQDAYTKTINRDDLRYLEAADFFKKKSVSSESAEPVKKKRRA
jgi:hypothetical protein